jgi:hypothetical protein
MEFIKVGKNYMIKNSNGRIISKEEKEKLENKEITIEVENCKDCEIKTKEDVKKVKSKINLYKKTNKKPEAKITALPIEENADDIIQETNTTI